MGAAPGRVAGTSDIDETAVNSEAQAATEDAIKVVHFIVRHNLALHLFSDLVKLAVDLGASRLRKLNAGENAAHTSSTTVSGLLQSLQKQVDAAVNIKIQQPPTECIGR